eukprot:2105197-Rhodomonas_salina.1
MLEPGASLHRPQQHPHALLPVAIVTVHRLGVSRRTRGETASSCKHAGGQNDDDDDDDDDDSANVEGCRRRTSMQK